MNTRRAIFAALALAVIPIAALAQDFTRGSIAYAVGDYETAVQEWRPLADQGHADAQTGLGGMYARGEGVPKDYAEAARWFRLAANQGEAKAQYFLGLMYDDGKGVIHDYVSAHMWFNIAGANGEWRGLQYLDYLEKRMTAEDISEARRRARVCSDSGYKDCGG